MAETRTSGSRDQPPPDKLAGPRAGDSDEDPYRGRPIGRILMKMGKLDRTQVGKALELQKANGQPFGCILVGLGWVIEADVQKALELQAGAGPSTNE
jgi:hypothetical protein